MMCADAYQSVRMGVIWPLLVGCVAFYTVVFIARALDGQLTRWQAVLAAVTGVCAAVVTVTVAQYWDGTPGYWLAFTVGLAFATAVLTANAVLMVCQARP